MEIQQLKNAITVIKQMRRGEWVADGHYEQESSARFTVFTINRNGVEIWVANGGFFCGVEDKPWELGIFGHLVWHFGAKQLKRRMEKQMRRKASVMAD